MRWLDTPSAGRSGFVWSRLLNQDVVSVVEVSRHGATYWVEFTRFAPEEARGLGCREFLTVEDAKAYALAVVRLS